MRLYIAADSINSCIYIFSWIWNKVERAGVTERGKGRDERERVWKSSRIEGGERLWTVGLQEESLGL
ncbi:hypothetical protein UPYG_G00339300 [Umbra pygmaea]|uniref:Uncharacterized protein n=1 Tax=Umbra pygmaea TaxID=75934 RepID=A0ABD0W0S8_UMBPY